MQKTFTQLCSLVALSLFSLCNFTEAMAQAGKPATKAAEAAAQISKLPSEIQELIKKARIGNAEAYEALGNCYRTGDNIKKSEFNAMFMYILAYEKTGKRTKNVLKKFDEKSPLRLITKLIDGRHTPKEKQELMANLKKVSPADALLAEAVIAEENKEDTVTYKRLLKEAVDKGSEMAFMIQLISYEKADDDAGFEKLIQANVRKHPMAYSLLGKNIYKKAYSSYEDEITPEAVELYKQALDYFQAADQWGTLMKNDARKLLHIYSILEKNTNISFEQGEKKRLEILSEIQENITPEP